VFTRDDPRGLLLVAVCPVEGGKVGGVEGPCKPPYACGFDCTACAACRSESKLVDPLLLGVVVGADIGEDIGRGVDAAGLARYIAPVDRRDNGARDWAAAASSRGRCCGSDTILLRSWRFIINLSKGANCCLLSGVNVNSRGIFVDGMTESESVQGVGGSSQCSQCVGEVNLIVLRHLEGKVERVVKRGRFLSELLFVV